MKRIKHLLILACLTCMAPAIAMVTVGLSPGLGVCDYTTIQDAIDSGDNVINVLNNQTFSENLQINSGTNILGGFPTCADAAASTNQSGLTVIDGASNPSESVITIVSDLSVGGLIRFFNLELTNAIDASGLHITGTGGTVWVHSSIINNNSAENGGGVYLNTSSSDLQVRLLGTSINNNSASLSGGAIFCDRNSPNANVTIASISISSSIEMINNNAALSGGGIAAMNGCTVSLNFLNQGIIQSNNAGFGGAMSLTSHASLTMIGQINQPILLEQNSSISHGGAIYVSNASYLNMHSVDFNSNSSSNGNGGAIYINGLDGTNIASLLRAKLFDNSASSGAAIYVKDIGEETRFLLSSSMLYENGDGNDKYLIRSIGSAPALTAVDIRNSTIVDNNTDPSFSVLASNTASLIIDNSIIHNAGYPVLDSVVSTNNLICLLVNEDASISGQVSQLRVVTNYNAFDFIDSVENDYRLGQSSTAIDWCDAGSSTSNDIENQVRGWDAPNIDNGFGTYDAGADESYIFDIIFENSFE